MREGEALLVVVLVVVVKEGRMAGLVSRDHLALLTIRYA